MTKNIRAIAPKKNPPPKGKEGEFFLSVTMEINPSVSILADFFFLGGDA